MSVDTQESAHFPTATIHHSLKVRDVLFEFHLKFGIPPVLVFQLIEVYYKVDRLLILTGLTTQQKGTIA